MSSVKKNASTALKLCGITDKRYQKDIVHVAKTLLKMNDIIVLSHRSPDGDTLGCAAALCRGLRSLGKRVNTVCADAIPGKYAFMFEGVKEQSFTAQHYVTVDIAAPHLLGTLESEYAGKIDVCIDHHHRNSIEAPVKFVDTEASATGEIIWMLLRAMNAPLDKATAECLFAAISTDTGCFKYSNVTTRTHAIAMELMQYEIDCAHINFKLIDEETKAKMMLKKMALDTLEYFCDDRGAIITITSEMMETSQAMPEDMDGVASIPRSISGVECGITMKQDGDAWKVSVRSADSVNASDLCAQFGGGGHSAAAGCKLAMSYEEAKTSLIEAATKVLQGK